jgi:hypothetical protein
MRAAKKAKSRKGGRQRSFSPLYTLIALAGSVQILSRRSDAPKACSPRQTGLREWRRGNGFKGEEETVLRE